MDVPAGWQIHTRKSPLTEPWEPLYARQRPRSFELAVQVRPVHCNGRGTAHGGLIAALADNAMGLSASVAVAADAAGAADAGPAARGAVTVSLAMDYLDAARVDEWLEIRPSVIKAGRTLAFVECHVLCGERIVARGNATFKLG